MDHKIESCGRNCAAAKQVDVLVAGGGTAGCFAAIAAAKTGASVLLIEKNAVLGGTMTAGGVAFPGLFTAWGKTIIDGPCREAILRTAACGGAKLPEITYHPAHHWQEQVAVNRFLYAAVLDSMCAESGADVLLHTMLYDAEEKPDGVLVHLATKDGPAAVFAREVIDATADANLTAMLGYPLQESEELQPATLINDIGGYEPEKLDRGAFEIFLQQEMEAGRLTAIDCQGASLWDHLMNRRLSMHIDAPEAHTSRGRGALERRARASLLRIVTALRRFPGLEALQVTSFADECGVRETRRILGETVMDAERYIAGYRYPDAVCYAFYPIDRHLPVGIYQVFHEPERVGTIPYRALIPQKSTRLLAAGRCVSSDRDTNSAVRVAAPCMAMGQAAGAAAALAAKQNLPVGAVPYDALCGALRAMGAIVPAEDAEV